MKLGRALRTQKRLNLDGICHFSLTKNGYGVTGITMAGTDDLARSKM
jgi:hypothetical protein